MKLLAILLTVVFVTLKLLGVIAWGWVLVFSPIIALAVFALACLLVFVAVFVAGAMGVAA